MISEVAIEQRNTGISLLYDDQAVQRHPAPALAGEFSIPKGSELSLQYRLFVFTGTGDPAQIEDAYSAWSAQ